MNSEINYVSPFKKFCITIGNLPTAYLESMSYYEGLTYLVNYLSNNVIPALNNNGEVVEELQAQFTILKNYVDNYFENLDVQEEINNKLDEMATSGELTDIIAQYLGLAGILVYNTVNDLKNAKNIVSGSKCKTFGYYNINDGGSAYYLIRPITNVDVIDEMTILSVYDVNLVAELQTKEMSYLIPEMLGAKGDGTTDDTAAFEKLFDLGLPIKCISTSVYGIKNCDMGNKNVFLDGNGCKFLNVQLNMSATAEDMYKTAMFYSGYDNQDGSNPTPNINIKNAIFDGNKENLTNIRAYWNAVFALINSENVKFENVTFQNTIGTANILTGVLNYSIENSTFNQISTREEVILSGTSRNGYEIFNTSYRATNNQYTSFSANNITCTNIHDSFGRFDSAKSVNTTNCYFKNVNNCHEQDISSSNTLNAPNKIINFSDNFIENAKVIFMTGSANDSTSYNTLININNVKSINNSLDNISSTGGFINIVGIGTIANINNLYLKPTDCVNGMGAIYIGKKGTVNISNSYIDVTTYSNKPIFVCPANANPTINIDKCNIISSGDTSDRLINTNTSSTTGAIIKINNSKIKSLINAEIKDIEINNSYIESTAVVKTGGTTTDNIKLTNNKFNVTSTSGYIFSTNQIPANLICDGNVIESESQHSFYVTFKPATDKFIFTNNVIKNIGNIGAALELQAESISIIHDNRCQTITINGTPTIAHDNVGITINS